MSRFIETIKLLNGNYEHLDLHLQRIQDTCMSFFGKHRDMKSLINSLQTKAADDTIYKVTVHYDFDNYHIENVPYQMRSIHNLVLIEDNEIDYSLKYADRTVLEMYQKLSGANNECIIIKNNRITDTSFSNIAFWNGAQWHTPLHPLLKGIKRKKLLAGKKIFEKDILASDLSEYTKVSLINSMLEPQDLVIDIGRIMFLSDL